MADTPPVDFGFIAKMMERYPGSTWVMQIPELRELLIKATQQEWAPDLFESQMRATNWWRTTEPKVREWVQLEATDPAAAANRILASKQQVGAFAAQLGVTIDDATATELATNYNKLGWNEQTLRQQVAGRVRPSTGALVDVKALADRYMVDISEDQAIDMTRRLFTGELTEDGLTSMLGQQATAAHPYLAEQMAKGILPGDYFGPYKSMISRLTDTPEAQVDLLRNPTWRAIVSHADPATKQIRAMTLNEAEHHIRGTNEFMSSRTGAREVAKFRTELERSLGMRA